MKFKKTIISLLIVATFLLNACSTTTTSTEETSTTASTEINTEVVSSDSSSDTTTNSETSDTIDNDEIAQSISDLAGITIHEASIELTDEDWQDILDNAIDEEFHTATITYDGVTLENVAFRTKGNSSLSSVANSDSERYGFKIKTNKYVDDQYLDGTNEFVLNASFSDPSYLREYITYSASEYLGLITPETEFVELTINGEDYGLYLYVESYDDTFMEANTDADDTQLYKADSDNCTLTTEDGTAGFELKEGDDEDLEKIQELIDTLDATTADNMEELENLLDVSSVLKYIALDYTFGSYDSYVGDKAHNYYLIYTDGEFHMLGWDYNMSFGGYPSDSGSSLTISADDLYIGTTSEERPIISKLLEVSEYETEFLGYVEDLKNWLADYDSALNEMGNDISEYVENDPTAFYTIEEFWTNVQGTDLTLDDLSTANSNKAERPERGMMPTDGEIPEGAPVDGEMPEGAPTDGEIPDDAPTDENIQGMPGRGQMGGDATSQATISINDYIRLRLEN